MKKVTILSLHLGYGGIEKSIAALANIICDKYEVEIISIYKLYDKPAFTINKKVKITYLLDTDLPVRLASYKELIQQRNFSKLLKKIGTDYLKKLKFISLIKDTKDGFSMYKKRFMVTKEKLETLDTDILISTRTFLNEWSTTYAKKNIIKIGWEHNHYHKSEEYAKEVVESAKDLDYFVFVSKDITAYYKKQLENTKCKCVYIPNMLDNIPEKVAPLEGNRLVSVGRLSKEKGYLDLVKIFNLMVEKHPKWHLDIIGDGPERDNIEEYIKENNLKEKITLHGFQKKNYIDKILHRGTLYLMTSYRESFGIVLLEAMSHGIPCIAFSSAEGAREIIENEKNGYLIEDRDPFAMIKKTEELMNDTKKRKKMGEKARKTTNNYTKEVVQKYWYKLLEKKVK